MAHNDDYWLSLAAKKLDRLKTVKEDGSVAFEFWNSEGLEYEDLTAIVGTHYRFEPAIPDVVRLEIVRKAITLAAKQGEIIGESLRHQLSKETASFKRLPLKDFVVITSLSVERPPDLEVIEFGGVTFRFTDRMPEGFSREGIPFYESFKSPKDLPKGFTVVRVEVKARSEPEAFENALLSVDFLRGIWNWVSSPVRMSYLPIPINTILLGPVHTLHQPTGEPILSFWYEPFYREATKVAKFNNWSHVKEFYEEILSLLANISYRSFIVEGFVRYARSLDTADHESSFLKVWGVLEYLTAYKEDENYRNLQKRVLFLCEDREYHEQILEHLRRRRNAAVHRGEATVETQKFIYQTKRYSEWLLRFHLREGKSFRTPEEAVGLLSQSSDMQELEKQIAIRQRALRFLRDEPESTLNSEGDSAASPVGDGT